MCRFVDLWHLEEVISILIKGADHCWRAFDHEATVREPNVIGRANNAGAIKVVG